MQGLIVNDVFMPYAVLLLWSVIEERGFMVERADAGLSYSIEVLIEVDR